MFLLRVWEISVFLEVGKLYIFYILFLIKLLAFRYIFKIEIFALFSIYIIRILKSEIFLLWNFGIWKGSLLFLSPFAKWKFLIRYSCKRDLTNSAFVKCCDCQTRNLYILQYIWFEKIFFIYSTHQCIKLQCLIFVSVPWHFSKQIYIFFHS